jgi:hypothetical protein
MRHSLPRHEPRASIRHLRENRRPVADFGLPKQPQKIIVEYLAPPDHGHELYEIHRRAFVFAVRFGPARHVGQSGVDGHDDAAANRPLAPRDTLFFVMIDGWNLLIGKSVRSVA